jgi:hypothetical protein
VLRKSGANWEEVSNPYLGPSLALRPARSHVRFSLGGAKEIWLFYLARAMNYNWLNPAPLPEKVNCGHFKRGLVATGVTPVPSPAFPLQSMRHDETSDG